MTIANVVSISGGKDSTATALLAYERGVENIRFVFADTGHEHPVTYKYVGYLNSRFQELTGSGIDVVTSDFSNEILAKRQSLIAHYIEIANMGPGNNRLKDFTLPILDRMIDALVPTGNPFLDLCLWKGRFPGTRSRFCSEFLKHAPLTKYHESLMGQFSTIVSWQGVRKDESKERALLTEREVEFGSWEPEPSGLLIYRPILDWTAEECFALHDKYGIDCNPLYKKGMRRVGCMPCIHTTKEELREIARRYPEVIERIAWMERTVSIASKRNASTFFDARVTAKYLGTGKTVNDISPITHGVETYLEWARTERGGRQQSLIAAIDMDLVPLCSSVYGLCE